MELILKHDVENLGFKDDLVKVKNGYGRNFLIPNGLAMLATESNKKVLAEKIKQSQKKREFGEAILLDNSNRPPSYELGDTSADTLLYSADGVHVGDAAQTQFGLSVRYEPTSTTYIKIRGTYFSDYYS